MSQADATAAAASGSDPERHANPSAAASKLRSCTICRSRKVRCDKQSPCSNCRAAGIACVFPSTDRPPRWARRLDRLANQSASPHTRAPRDATQSVGKVMERLHSLEGLVKELRGELQEAHAAVGSPGASSHVETSNKAASDHEFDSPPPASVSSIQKQYGRMVFQDTSRSRYVGSGFWSRINDELEKLKLDTRDLEEDESESSDDEISSRQSPAPLKPDYPPSDHYAFLFQRPPHDAASDLQHFHPLPSQIPFLLDVYSENIDSMFRIIHMPTVTKMVRDWRATGMKNLSPSNEALLFSIYFCAVTSMEDDDVANNFGCSKSDLTLKYRLGLEHALAKADFLISPNITLVQAFALFLLLARRHDNPRFVWMMTGLLIRMAQYLGLQRDGAHFHDLTPFEIEMRRRLWWTVCLLDIRACEDQGTDITIPHGSFDTKIPLNINDADLDPTSEGPLVENAYLTDMSYTVVIAGMTDVSRQLTLGGGKDGVAGLDEQYRLLSQLYEKFERYGNQIDGIVYWVGSSACKLVMAKMALIVSLPVLFSSPDDHVSDEIRTKLLVSAIEVAEYNHALNAEEAARRWRWIYQTHTHWYAIVYLMIEISRRPLSPTVERAWLALHSSWLFPKDVPKNKRVLIWVPLRKLMDKARKHRNSELRRLRASPQEAARLEEEDRKAPLPGSPGPFQTGFDIDLFRQRWRQLVTAPSAMHDDHSVPVAPEARPNNPWLQTSEARRLFAAVGSELTSSKPAHTNPVGMDGDIAQNQDAASTSYSNIIGTFPAIYAIEVSNHYSALEQTNGFSHDSPLPAPVDWSRTPSENSGTFPWLYDDSNFQIGTSPHSGQEALNSQMDLSDDVNWCNWIESAKTAEMNAWTGNYGEV